MRYKPYPKYKESGVAWLGEVPEHWEILNIKRLCFVKRGASPRPIENPIYFDNNGEYAWVRISDVTLSDMYLEKTLQRLSSLGKSLSVPLEPNDLFLSIAGSVGKPIIANIKCCIHDGFVYFKNYKENLKFLYWVFKSGQPYLGLGKFGTQLNLNKDTVGDIKIGLPPLEEQVQIVRYIEEKTQKIDTLIEKQQTLIKLLKEKRQALISHAVTKGLDDTVNMKDSGVAWLGEVPEDWEVKQVKYLLNNNIGIKIGPFGSALKLDDMVKKGYKVYGQENVIKSNFSLGKRFISNQKFNSMIVYKVEPNDILITMMGTIGKCIVVPKNIEVGIIDSHLIKIRTNELISSEYFSLMIDKSEVVKTQLELNSKGSIMQGLNSTIIKALIFPLPPIDEQYKILNYLDQKTNQIDTLISKSTQAIELLKERRSALISAVVTGKVDVRDA